MTIEKLTSILEFYHSWCKLRADFTHAAETPLAPWCANHIAWMCRTAVDVLLPAGRTDKAMRWLGFIQGCMVTCNRFTLEQVKEHSR